RRVATRARKETRALAQVLREGPYLVHDTLELMRSGELEIGFVHKGLGDFTSRLELAFNRLVVALVVAGGLVGSSLIGIFAKSGPHVLGLHFISLIGFLVSGVLGAWLLYGVLRSGRL